MQFTQKETSFLKDLKEHEQICIEKYNQYSSEAHDGQLKGMFKNIAQVEQQHLNTINQVMSGTVPSMQSGGSSGGSSPTVSFTPAYTTTGTDPNMQRDKYLCTDLLSTEKHVSSLYNTAIFEFKDTKVRDVLNHIQKEEQQHGEQIYQYMTVNGMYSG